MKTGARIGVGLSQAEDHRGLPGSTRRCRKQGSILPKSPQRKPGTADTSMLNFLPPEPRENTLLLLYKPPSVWVLRYGRPTTLTHTSASRPVLGSLRGSRPPRTPTLVSLGRVYLDAPRTPQLSFPAAGPGRAPVVAPGSWSR